jgi:integrase
MRGSLLQRGVNTWLIRLEFGYVPDPTTGKLKRVQKTETFHGSRRAAERRLNALTSDVQDGAYIAPDKRTVAQWLLEWVDLSIKPPRRTKRAYDTYRSVLSNHLIPALGHHRLQGLRALHIEALLASKSELAPATLEKIFTVLSSALKAAVGNRLVASNEASFVVNKPRGPEQSAADRNCWTADQAASFLVVAKAAGPQPAALWALALDSGMRKSELAGLCGTDVDTGAGRVQVRQQLLTGGLDPVFIPTKGKRSRVIDVAPETADLLKAHKAHQAELRMRFRQVYRDLGLVFAKEPSDAGRRVAEVLGTPLAVNNLGEREFAALVAAAGVPRISIHGLRHTCATLLLAAGVPWHVVQRRLGHKDASTTLDVYSHVLPDQQREAARQLAALLHRK